MATMIDRMQVQALLAEGLSLREIARRLKIPWATFRRHWQQLQREASTPVNAQVTEMPERGRPPVVDLSPPAHQHMRLPGATEKFWALRNETLSHKHLPAFSPNDNK
jgi:transposase